MRLNFTKSILTICLGIVCSANSNLLAQSTPDPESLDLGVFLYGGEEAAGELMGNYLNPVFVGFGYGAANGWYNTAKTHKPLGFDLTATVSLAKAPSSDLFFDFLSAGDPNNGEIRTASQSTESLPTVFGDDSQVLLESVLTGNDPTGQPVSAEAQFYAPPGLNLSDDVNGYVPMPMIQLGLGLIKNTDLKVRWMPTQESEEDGYKVSMFGLGLMHDFKQWIPGLKHIPIDMSIMVGYNRINTTLDLENGLIDGEDQVGEIGINSWTYQVLVSKKLSILTLYGGFGYNNSSSSLDVKGTYLIEGDDGNGNTVTIPLEDPVAETYVSNGFRGTAGLRLKFAIITLHADYTFQEYNTITAGIGLSIR